VVGKEIFRGEMRSIEEVRESGNRRWDCDPSTRLPLTGRESGNQYEG
jgi:hypothetical protein